MMACGQLPLLPQHAQRLPLECSIDGEEPCRQMRDDQTTLFIAAAEVDTDEACWNGQSRQPLRQRLCDIGQVTNPPVGLHDGAGPSRTTGGMKAVLLWQMSPGRSAKTHTTTLTPDSRRACTVAGIQKTKGEISPA
jgi:hypothetical protein